MENNTDSNENSFLANNPALNTIDLPKMESIDQNTDENSIGERRR